MFIKNSASCLDLLVEWLLFKLPKSLISHFAAINLIRIVVGSSSTVMFWSSLISDLVEVFHTCGHACIVLGFFLAGHHHVNNNKEEV